VLCCMGFHSFVVVPATERLKELNKLLEDVAKTAVSTGPRGAIRLAQGIEAVVTVGGEYLFQLLTVSLLLCKNACINACVKSLLHNHYELMLIGMWIAEPGSKFSERRARSSFDSPGASRAPAIV
jgi:hypothetical protein